MTGEERKPTGEGGSRRESGGNWISEQEEVFLQCSLERGKACLGEERASCPSGRGSCTCETDTCLHPGPFCLVLLCPGWSCHEGTYRDAALDTEQEGGEKFLA